MIIRLFLLMSLVFVAACGPSYQTTSGAAFVEQRPNSIDKDIARIASVEPNLNFPGRIGVARVVNGRLTALPAQEIEIFGRFAEDNPRYGEIVGISPLIAQMIQEEEGRSGIIRSIRQTAARQHLDYVLVYEVGARSSVTNTPFALADVTLIGGMLLPTRNIKTAGVASAAFLDVRNGYPYGTVAATKDLSGLSRTFGEGIAKNALQQKAILKTTQALMPKVEEMLDGLYRRQ